MNVQAISFVVLMLVAYCFTPLAHAQINKPAKQCIQRLQQQAKVAGISNAVIDEIIPKLNLLPKVIGYDRSQPEFTQTFASYLSKRVTPLRIKQGHQLLKKHRPFLNKLVNRYGIPERYIIAFWGLETNYGQYLGKLSTLDALTTLACDKRRSTFFTQELLLALKLIDKEALIPDLMQGSWAGAMGHTQFMPSTYFHYAVDGDNDGKINLWQSERDAFASSANYLQQLGWKTGERWGREVQLSDDFPYEKTGLKHWQSLAEWKKLGVTKANGRELPDVDIKAAILVPSGHTGPAFMVYPNFEIIMKWNNSTHYALAVGLLADSVLSSSKENKLQLVRPPKNQQPMEVQLVKLMQQSLNTKGFDAGHADGIIGSKTQEAIQAFQKSKGLIADGYPDALTVKTLQSSQ